MPQNESATVATPKYAKPGPYVTKLPPAEELEFRKWVATNRIPWQDSSTSDYDMRGFWKAMQSGDPNAKRASNLHFPDTWKTPYHKTFSNESEYALPTAPHWEGGRLVPTQNDNVNVDVRLPSGRIAHIPRENLVKIKHLGAVEVTPPEKPGGYAQFSHELARNMGFDPEKIQKFGGKSQLKQMLEAGKEFMVGTGKWMESTAKDPFHIVDPIHAVASGVTKAVTPSLDTSSVQGVKDIYSGVKDPKSYSREALIKKGAEITAALANLSAGADRGGAVRDVAGLPKAALETAGKGVKEGARSMLGAGEKVVERAKTAAEEAAAKKTAEYAEKKAKYDAKVAEAKAEHEAKMAERQAKHEADVIEAKAAHEAKLGAAEQSLAGRVSREAHSRLKESRLNAATKKLTAARDNLVRETAKNLEAAETAERKSLDARYEDFRQKVLGVTPQTPNGTLQAKLSPIGEAVLNAKKNILKGSRTNITIFNDIMGRLKDLVESPEGEVKPLEGQMIPTDQLRGYFKELGDKIFDSEVPGDVRRALDHVREASQSEIKNSIKDVHGQGALDVYDKLSEDWSGYKRVWYDRTSGSPLPRILKTMRSPVAVHEGVNMEGQIADLLGKKHAGQSLTTLLARKSQFGARPELVARLMAISKKLAGLPDLYETIPVAKYPRFPGEFKPEEAPKAEPFKNTRDEPDKPNIEPFNRQGFIRDTVRKKIQTAGNYGMGFTALSGLTDLLHGNVAGTLSMAERIAVMQAIKTILASDKVVNWLSNGGTQ